MDIVVSSDVETFAPKPKENKKPRKSKKNKKKTPATGLDVVQSLVDKKWGEPQKSVNEPLPTYEDMMDTELKQEVLPSSYADMINELFGPSSMETQPDLEQVAWQEYMMDVDKPLHSTFLLPDQGLALGYPCPVFFGNSEDKERVAEILCNNIHPRLQQNWGTFSCHCGWVPSLKLSQTPKNPNKVFLACPKVREERCNYFQWSHQPPRPDRLSKASSPTTLKKRLASMVTDKMSLEKKQKTEGGFTFPPIVKNNSH